MTLEDLAFNVSANDLFSATFKDLKNHLDRASFATKGLNTQLRSAGKAIAENMKSNAEFKKMMFDVNDFGAELQFKKQKKAMADAEKEARRFKGEYLSMMLGFMQISRFLDRIIQGLYKNFMDLTKNGINPLGIAFTRLEANMKYLQFSMMDALAPVLIPLIDMLSGLAQVVAESDPETLKQIGEALLVFAGITTLATVASGISLLWSSGLEPMFAKIGAKSIGDSLANLDRSRAVLEGFKKAGQVTAGLFFTIEGIKDFSEGKFLSGVGDMLQAFGSFKMDSNTGKYSFIIGSALKIADAYKDSGFDAALDSALNSAFIYGVLTGNPYLSVAVAIDKIILFPAVREWLRKTFNPDNKYSTTVNPFDTSTWAMGAWQAPGDKLRDEKFANAKKSVDDLGQGMSTMYSSVNNVNQTIPQFNTNLSTMSTTISGDAGLTNSFDTLNPKIDATKTTFIDINSSLSNNITHMQNSIPQLKLETDARNLNAESLFRQGQGYLTVARGIMAVKDAQAYTPSSSSSQGSAAHGTA